MRQAQRASRHFWQRIEANCVAGSTVAFVTRSSWVGQPRPMATQDVELHSPPPILVKFTASSQNLHLSHGRPSYPMSRAHGNAQVPGNLTPGGWGPWPMTDQCAGVDSLTLLSCPPHTHNLDNPVAFPELPYGSEPKSPMGLCWMLHTGPTFPFPYQVFPEFFLANHFHMNPRTIAWEAFPCARTWDSTVLVTYSWSKEESLSP